MTDWIKHDTDLAEQAYQQWVDEGMQGHDVIGVGEIAARLAREAIQHLIDAARLEGIRLGLEAADKAIEALVSTGDLHIEEETALEEASIAICTLNSEAIAKEADNAPR
jgi:hypothetical protein